MDRPAALGSRRLVADTRLSRRRFVHGAGVAGLGLLAGCGRLPGVGTPPPKVARLGYMGNPVRVHWFREGLRELGYVEGDNLVIESRAPANYGAGPYAAPVEELVRLRPDVLVTATTPQTLAAQQATTTIPVVFIAVSDPVGVGIVASLARPGGNITGQSDFFAGLAGKRLELLKELVPSVARVAALWNPRNPATALEWSSLQEASRALGLELLSMDVQSRDHLTSAFDRMTRDRADALIVLSDGLFALAETPQLPGLVIQSRLPTMYYVRDGVTAGMLMSYGPNLDRLYWRAAYYVDRILKGTNPADLPVEQPREFDFIINLRTAQALGLTIPHHVLLQATEVIQ
jgi:putative tryptophan/tyrosine transport system substrate-binding protein